MDSLLKIMPKYYLNFDDLSSSSGRIEIIEEDRTLEVQSKETIPQVSANPSEPKKAMKSDKKQKERSVEPSKDIQSPTEPAKKRKKKKKKSKNSSTSSLTKPSSQSTEGGKMVPTTSPLDGDEGSGFSYVIELASFSQK